MYGLLKEHGPYLVEARKPPYGDPYLIPNEFSWHKSANMLYIDNPVGTGFSHMTNPNAFQREKDQVSREIADFLLQFLELYPYYVGSFNPPKIYLFGESYGGTYVINLASFIYSNREIYKVSQSHQSKHRKLFILVLMNIGLLKMLLKFGQNAVKIKSK